VIPIAATLPWLVPGVAISLVVSVLASGALGRWLRVRRSVAWGLLMSVGVILAATLSPLERGEVVAPGLAPGLALACDLSRTRLPSLDEVLYGEDVAINILMLVPLGFAIGLVPLSWRKVVVLVAAALLPPAIETVQLLSSGLGRACQGADVVDNLTGLAIGVVTGAVTARLAPGIRRPLSSVGRAP
jgi:VanZ like protein